MCFTNQHAKEMLFKQPTHKFYAKIEKKDEECKKKV